MIYADYYILVAAESSCKTPGGVTFDLRRLRPDERSRFVNSVLNGKAKYHRGAVSSA